MLHAGIGETHLNNFLTALDVPPICHKTLKKMERRFGVALETTAKRSCLRNLQKECELSHEAFTTRADPIAPSSACSSTPNSLALSPSTLSSCEHRLEEGYDIFDADYEAWKSSRLSGTDGSVVRDAGTLIDITVSYDMGWAKRGRAMNSQTGTGANVGSKTNKVIGYAMRNKRCITCDIAAREGREPKPHDCCRNHVGSSKSMEPAVAVELAKESQEHGAKIACLIGDDDSSTIKKLSESVSADIKKQSDIGHAKRSLGSKLYEAKQKQKDCKQITNSTITYFQKMFSYALQNNANNVAGLQKTLLAVVPHAFGDHGHCSDSWCGYLKKSSGYKHSGLPYGKDLSCTYTKALLTRLFQGLSDSAEKLAPLGSSQVNEALNNTIASKAPKSRHYGGSESQDFRTAAAVLQKNEGQQYLPQAIIEAGGSPSAPLQQRARYKDKVALTRSERASSKSSKLRRRLLRQNHSAHLASAELREGTTYRSGCALLPADLDTEGIPSPLSCTTHTPVQCPSSCTVVYFDLETTGLSRQSELTQIAAKVRDGTSVFNTYLLPSSNICSGATSATGLSIGRKNGERILVKNGQPVEAASQVDGLKKFAEWLDGLSRSIVLVAHNAFSFDVPVFLNALDRADLTPCLVDVVHGFGDSLPALKRALHEESSHSLPHLHQTIVKSAYNAHDASADVLALKVVLKEAAVSIDDHTASYSSAVDRAKSDCATALRRQSLEPLVLDKALTSTMASRAAASGLNYHHCHELPS